MVVALHGCSQDAHAYDHGAGKWSSLADRWGFLVVYPEQQLTNNQNNCFSWFLPGDTARGNGEALSIHQMVEHAIGKFGADPEKVFVTGLSAGGAMAVVMLATYPETFAGGVYHLLGFPTGAPKMSMKLSKRCSAIVILRLALSATACERHLCIMARGRKSRSGNGSADPIVKPSNAEANHSTMDRRAFAFVYSFFV